MGLVQGFVHTGEDPAEKALISGFGQSLYGKIGLQQGSKGTWLFPAHCTCPTFLYLRDLLSMLK